MKFRFCMIGAVLIAASQLAPSASAQIPGSSQPAQPDGEEQAVIQPTAIHELSLEEQLKIRAAQQKAAEDPAVKAALEKRNQAIAEFRMTMRKAIIKADPKLEPVLDKIAVGSSPGF